MSTTFGARIRARSGPDLVTVAQAVEEFGLSRVTLFRMMATGELTRYRVKGQRASLVDRREVRQQLQPRAVTL
jgi:DNA-binding transcriptional regulator PaaX